MPRVNSNQPYDPVGQAGGGGYYRQVIKTGQVGATLAAGAIIFAMQWAPTDAQMGRKWRFELKYFRCYALTVVAFSAAQLVDCYLFKVRGFTGADTGGTQVVPATLDQKEQNRYADSKLVTAGDLRIASTAALSAGTRTPEAQAQLTCCSFWSAAIGNASPEPRITAFDEHNIPITFESGEGFEVQNGTAFGGKWPGTRFPIFGFSIMHYIVSGKRIKSLR
jgi:hypothetical protein